LVGWWLGLYSSDHGATTTGKK